MKNITTVFFATFILAASFSCSAADGFNQNYNGSTQVCNASAPEGCKNAFVANYNEYKKYVQNYGDGAVVCNTTVSSGCGYNGIVAKKACWVDDGKMYCY